MHDIPLLTTIAAAFTAAWILGLLTQKLKLSPIVGYLLAGVVIGPRTPGFTGDVHLAQQLAELGVILLMFGVGLHFHLKDLLAVKNVAVPGAVGQSLIATLLALVVAELFGMSHKAGLVLGIAMSVASTVVLIRMLMDNRMLDTVHGHVAVGWLIVEDIFTVVVLVLMPTLAAATESTRGPVMSLLIALIKLSVMTFLILWGGARVIPWIMARVTRFRSRELFTLTVLVLAIAVATGSAYLFGASMALGAFLAGMVVGQSSISKQAAADALPLRDAFAVLFFTSVGMLFDPMFIVRHPVLTLACLGVVMIGKPLSALLIVALIGYPVRTALTVAIGLAQIGEFSFILSDVARKNGLLDDAGHNVLVACALISISLNPILFQYLNPLEKKLQKYPRLWKLLNGRSDRRADAINLQVLGNLEKEESPLALILGYGPVGQTIDELLRARGLETVVVDLNMDTIESLNNQNRKAIYGDAYNILVIAQALPRATHLIITIPHGDNRESLIASAKLINPTLKVYVRARYIAEQTQLKQVDADEAIFEETEAAVALARLVLEARGETADSIRHETTLIRAKYAQNSAA